MTNNTERDELPFIATSSMTNKTYVVTKVDSSGAASEKIDITHLIEAHTQRKVLEARLDEARHWDEHVIGGQRKVTTHKKADDRLTALKQQLKEVK